MINSFKAEWRKLRQRPAVWVLGGIMLAAIFLFGYAFNWLQLSFPSKNFHGEAGLTIAQLKTALYPSTSSRTPCRASASSAAS